MFLARLGKHGRKPSRGKVHRPRSAILRCGLERLEDRTVLSLFTPSFFAVGTRPVGQAVGDFNGDGHADLVVVNQNASTLSVLIGNGDGTFQPKTDYATGATPMGVAVGDFNGDGKLDLATANFGGKSVSVLLGNGDGTFQPKTDIALSTTPVSLAVADLNADGKLDLEVATEDLAADYVSVLRGVGDGTFLAPVNTVSDTAGKGIALIQENFSTITTGDFNGDGRPDVVVVNSHDFWTQRSGQFFTGGTVSVLLGNGDGTLQAPRIFAVGTSPRSVAAGDFNGDGRLDFAVGNYLGGTVSLFMNTGGGSFSTSTLTLNGAADSLAAADFNGDGRSDLAVAVDGSGFVSHISVYAGQAGGTLAAPALYLASGVVTAADLNADGHQDILMALPSVNAVGDLLNEGNGTFPAPILIPNPGVTLSSQATTDFNGDGIADLATSGQVQLGLGDGSFGDLTPLMGGSGTGVAVADVDGNGTPDVLVGSPNFPLGDVALYTNSPGWDNRTAGAVNFVVSAPQQVTAGSNVSVTVTAVDALGNPVAGFHGTVDLDASAAGSTALKLLSQYSFTAADAGRHTFVISNLTQAGAFTLSTFAVAMPTVSAPVDVVPAALAKFAFAAPGSIPAGTPFSFTITAEDRFGNVETGYTGTVHFGAMTTDTSAVLPADSTFTAADAGSHTFSATLFKTSGTSSPFISAKDISTGVSSLVSLNVTPLAVSSLSMTLLPNPYPAGTPYAVTVMPLDIYGNMATSYTGTVHFTSSDPRASLPADYTFRPGQGFEGFSITLKTLGTQSLTVADTTNPALTASQAAINVVPGTAVTWVFSGLPASVTAGTAQSFTLTALDAAGNVATGYFGTVRFTSSDPQAILPAIYTFTPADAGSHTFTATWKTAGTQSLTVADLFNSTFTGTQSTNVTAAAAATMTLTGFPATIAGVAQNFTVTLRDAFGNLASGYTGTLTFSSSDPLAALPADYTFTAADGGVHTFTGALKKAGTQSITVTDRAAPTLTSTESGISVSAAAVAGFAISGPASVTQGVGFKITVSAVDAFGNVNAGYRGAVHLSSTDSTGGTQNFTFSNNDNGVHIFSYTFNALGFQTLTIVDTTNGSIAGSIVIDVLPKA